MSSTLRPWQLRGPVPDLASRRPSATSDRPSIDDLRRAVARAEVEGNTDVEGRFLWGSALLASGRPHDAVAAFAPALEREDAPGRLFVLAAVARQDVGPPLTAAELEDLVPRLKGSEDRNTPALWMATGRVLVAGGFVDKAEAAFELAVRAAGRDRDAETQAWALREAAQLALLDQRLDRAKALLFQARRLASSDEIALLTHLDEARIHGLQGAWPACVSSLQAALTIAEERLAPDDPLLDHTLISLAAARMETDGAPSETERLLRRAFGMRLARCAHPAEPTAELTEAMLLLGEHHRVCGRLDDALPLLARAATARERTDDDPSVAHAYLVWSRALDDKGLTEAAAAKRALASARIARSNAQSGPGESTKINLNDVKK